jgi:hypothetical protein
LKITPDGSGTSIEATPKLFENGGDISDLAVWDLGGNGQPKLWEQLFNEIASNLGETASSPPAQAGQKSEP